MHRALLLALLASLPLFVPACDVGGTDCTTQAVASVSITLQDAEGNPVSASEITYTVDGGAEQSAECMDDDCTTAVAGWEVAGDFVITAIYDEPHPTDECCWYYDSATAEVSVAEGECHVDGQTLALTLDPDALACADECG